MTYAPICLFVYSRLEETKRTVQALQNNYLAYESELIIFSDGAKDDVTQHKVENVREYLKTIHGFKTIKIVESETNKGLANSVISGVTELMEQYEKVIVIEDDLIVSNNFLDYMNQALSFYQNIETVFSISGFCLKILPPNNYNYDTFFWGRPHSWGWATWKNRWESVDWQIEDWEELKTDQKAISDFNQYGTDLFKMLKNSIEGKNSSWFIRFAYNQYKQKKLTVYPLISKVINEGFDKDATHCNSYNRNIVYFDKSNQRDFIFSTEYKIIPTIRKQLFYYKSYRYRIIGKFLTLLLKLKIIKQQTQKY